MAPPLPPRQRKGPRPSGLASFELWQPSQTWVRLPPPSRGGLLRGAFNEAPRNHRWQSGAAPKRTDRRVALQSGRQRRTRGWADGGGSAPAERSKRGSCLRRQKSSESVTAPSSLLIYPLEFALPCSSRLTVVAALCPGRHHYAHDALPALCSSSAHTPLFTRRRTLIVSKTTHTERSRRLSYLHRGCNTRLWSQ